MPSKPLTNKKKRRKKKNLCLVSKEGQGKGRDKERVYQSA
jgi:hypothetical protein